MMLEHVATWTADLEQAKAYYETGLDAQPNNKYPNVTTGFESYFLAFASGAKLTILSRPGIPSNHDDTISQQQLGLIHLAFGVDTMKEVDNNAIQRQKAGFTILRGPRKTSDGYHAFEALDPDNSCIEVTTRFVEKEQMILNHAKGCR